MINRVYEVLKSLNVPMKWNKCPDFNTSKTVLSYHFFNEGELLHGDGESVEEGGALQVDIYSKTDYSRIVNQTKKLLKDAHFYFESGDDTAETLDNTTMIYHKVLIFNYIESEVMKNG